jgi:hypothetical protein
MRPSLALSFALLAIPAAGDAQAACTRADLAGTWVIGSEYGYCTATVSSTGRLSGGCGSGSIAITSACKVTGTIQGERFEGRTEALSPRSALKPNHIIGYGPGLGGIAGYRR